MWPGQQPPGGEQKPQDPQQNPYGQPGYPQQPNPYQQQPGYQQPNPYAQPAGPQPGQPTPPPGAPQWPAQAAPAGPQPPGGGRNKRTAVIAVTAAVAVVAAAVVTGVVVLKDDGGGEQEPAAKDAKPSASAPVSPSAEAPEDNPRAGGEVKPVIEGWKTVSSSKRHNAFDVPPDWEVEPPNTSYGFEDDKGKGLVSMTSTASYKKGECAKDDKRGAAGTKGAQGAKSEASAAEIEAVNWAYAVFDTKNTGKYKESKAQPFKSDHGITGYTASATVTGVNKTEKCMTDGKVFTVTYKDVNGDLATWVLYAATGIDSELQDDTIKKIMSSLRPLKSS